MKGLRTFRGGTAVVAAVVVVVLGSLAAAAAGRTVGHGIATTRASIVSPTLVRDLALARAATAKFVDNLPLAKRDGYGIITKMIPNMGYHFMNPRISGFNVTKPPILVYEHNGATWQLGALEWVYTSKPATPPLPGATYGAFGAGCHYKDGSFVPAATQAACPKAAPGSGAAFNFWHPLLITMHVWLWQPNPSGLFSGINPLAAAYNQG